MAAKVKKHAPRNPGMSPSPYGPTPLAHVGFQDSRHLHPERLPSGKREKTVSLRLIDASKETISNVQKLSATVRRLSASNLHLTSLPEDLIGCLVHLTKLDLSNNKLNDSSFPECMRQLEQLVDVRLAGNSLTKVPHCIRHMRHLSRLDLSDNQIDSGNGLQKLTRLRILVLDNNRLSSLFKEIADLRRLDVLRCSRNTLREVSREVRQLKSLVDLDISENRISVLPADVLLLPKLDVLNASKNEVTKVPTFNIRPQNKRWVTHIDLSDNKLIKFPSHLLLMTSKLDLSNNKIRSLPYHTLKKLDTKTNQELLLKDNPLNYPPSDVCDTGLRSILSYFQESESEVKVYQGLKILVLGHHRSGKTSLVQTLLDQQPRMSEEIQSGGIDVYDMTIDLEERDTADGRPGKTLELCIWDFCGHPFYMYPYYSFFEHPTLTILTFSLAEYSEASFEEQIWCWFNWMLAKTNKVVALLVGTQCDKLDKTQASKVCHDVKVKLSTYLDEQTNILRQKIRDIEERPHISPTMSEQLKSYMRLLQSRVVVQTEVFMTSSKTFLGFEKVRHAIETLSGNRQMFSNVMRVVPTFWLDVRNYIEDRGNAMAFPVMTWQTFQEEVTMRFGMKHLMKAISQYLHETGQIIWFSNVDALKDLVFIRPSWLFDVFSSVVRHDLDNVTFSPDERQRSAGLTATKFEKVKKDALSQGIIDRDLFKCLLATLFPVDLASMVTRTIELLSEKFELCYPVENLHGDSVYKFGKYVDEREKSTQVLFPWLRKNTEPEEFVQEWESLSNNRKLVCLFAFPLYLPPGLFEIVTVRAHEGSHKLCFKHQWGGGIHAVHEEENVHLQLTYYREDDGKCDNKGMIVKYEVRGGKSSETQQASLSMMWSILLPLLLDFEKLMTSYSGVLVERFTQCPHCGRPSFLGEWLTPKETQGLDTRFCEVCKQEVDTAFLVQPREQKKVIIKRKPSPPPPSTPPPPASPPSPRTPGYQPSPRTPSSPPSPRSPASPPSSRPPASPPSSRPPSSPPSSRPPASPPSSRPPSSLPSSRPPASPPSSRPPSSPPSSRPPSFPPSSRPLASPPSSRPPSSPSSSRPSSSAPSSRPLASPHSPRLPASPHSSRPPASPHSTCLECSDVT